MISLQRSMHSSQMYTPGPAISFLTCFWLLPQNEHLSRSAPSPTRAIGTSCSSGFLLGARRPADPGAQHHCTLCRPGDARANTGRVSAARCSHGGPRTRARGPARPAAAGAEPRAWSVVSARGDGGRLAALEHLVDQAVLLGRLRREDLVPLDVVADLFDVLARVLRHCVLQPLAHTDHLVGVDLD